MTNGVDAKIKKYAARLLGKGYEKGYIKPSVYHLVGK